MYQSWLKDYEKILNGEDKMEVGEAIEKCNSLIINLTNFHLGGSEAIATVLEDRERLIEENKQWKEYKERLDILNSRDFVCRDKIREKIKELKNDLEEDSKGIFDCMRNQERIMELENQIEVLEELVKESN